MSPPTVSLTCRFTLKGMNLAPDDALGVSYNSFERGYGGVFSAFTPATAGPVTTGLWDSDGNVLFTVHLTSPGGGSPPPATCLVNSGSNPGHWVPLIHTSGDGMTCNVVRTGFDARTNTCDYTLELTVVPE